MEEISSLDSFQTDEANSSARPESENTQQSFKEPEESAAPDLGDATKDNVVPVAEDEAGSSGGGVGDVPTNEDDFEQISEGTFEVDENSRATSVGHQPDENPDTNAIQTDDPNEEKKPDDEDNVANNGDDSRNFEEVDAHVSANPASHDESDMLGEADNTLPQSGEEDDNAMDVDEAGNEDKDVQDVEMPSTTNSPGIKDDSLNPRFDNDNDSMEPLQQELDADEEEKVEDNCEDIGEDDQQVGGQEGINNIDEDDEEVESKDVVDECNIIEDENDKTDTGNGNEIKKTEAGSEKVREDDDDGRLLYYLQHKAFINNLFFYIFVIS